jgi:hypothetical protein
LVWLSEACAASSVWILRFKFLPVKSGANYQIDPAKCELSSVIPGRLEEPNPE